MATKEASIRFSLGDKGAAVAALECSQTSFAASSFGL